MTFNVFHPCSPYCGYCKPPKKFAVVCETCGWTDREGQAVGLCPKCGAALPPIQKPEPIMCYYVEAICANPCGKGRRSFDAVIVKLGCEYHTPA